MKKIPPRAGTGAFALEAAADGECAGYCGFSLRERTVRVNVVEADDDDIRDGLVRAAAATLYMAGLADFFVCEDAEWCARFNFERDTKTDVADLFGCGGCKNNNGSEE